MWVCRGPWGVGSLEDSDWQRLHPDSDSHDGLGRGEEAWPAVHWLPPLLARSGMPLRSHSFGGQSKSWGQDYPQKGRSQVYYVLHGRKTEIRVNSCSDCHIWERINLTRNQSGLIWINKRRKHTHCYQIAVARSLSYTDYAIFLKSNFKVPTKSLKKCSCSLELKCTFRI